MLLTSTVDQSPLGRDYPVTTCSVNVTLEELMLGPLLVA